MASQEHLDKMQLRQSYRNLWHTDLMSTIRADFPFCCLALWCGPCVSYMLRKRALYNDMSRYVCCAGYLPCSGKCGERRCPEFCLCTEGFMFCLQQVACIFSIVAMIVGSEEIQEASQILSCLSDFVYCTVCACMQTQHKVEMDKRDGKFGPPPAMAVPPVQQMSRIDQPIPPPAGYAPQPAYGQPYGYPPPAYPPTGYPPAYPPAGSYPPPGSYAAPGYPPAGYPNLVVLMHKFVG
ncbi:PLAC8 family [Musa troglodytarum]|uniref:PLAC8 family n=1 Tax=Musa troglodytarum TaxID=320322 RepID=A0A9E7FS25_9LILI|nr:PLAC8 family [Musa troglodytarum]